jgi:hypothetical protein
VPAFKLEEDNGRRLYAHFPGVPLQWLQGDVREFEEEWQAWDEEGMISAIFVQRHGYLEWDEAVADALRAAAADRT